MPPLAICAYSIILLVQPSIRNYPVRDKNVPDSSTAPDIIPNGINYSAALCASGEEGIDFGARRGGRRASGKAAALDGRNSSAKALAVQKVVRLEPAHGEASVEEVAAASRVDDLLDVERGTLHELLAVEAGSCSALERSIVTHARKTVLLLLFTYQSYIAGSDTRQQDRSLLGTKWKVKGEANLFVSRVGELSCPSAGRNPQI